MRSPDSTRRFVPSPGVQAGVLGRLSLLLLAALLTPNGSAQPQPPHPRPTPPPPPMILTVEGTNVWVQRHLSNTWETAYPTQVLAERDRGRTGPRSRATVRLSDLSVARINERSEFEIQPLPDSQADGGFSLFRGLIYLLHRDRPGSHRFQTPTATAATRGTEFTLEVEEGTGRTLLTVLEGQAELSNSLGSIRLDSGEQGVAERGQAPAKTAVIDTRKAVQWCLYYPGVLDVAELQLDAAETAALAASLHAWREGDLLRAMAAYPDTRAPASEHERVYLAALLLAVGQVAQAEEQLHALGGPADPTSPASPTSPAAHARRLAAALQRVIGAVAGSATADPIPATTNPPPATLRLATEWLAESYASQAASRLGEALAGARAAVRQSPEFAFAWTRVAELEFSHGRLRQAHEALGRSLALAPRNAQTLALRGFVLAAQNKVTEATGLFEQAMAIDGGLGNAWLGRGLCRIRQGRVEEGRLDLQVAATTEPRRSLLRSYLGKAFANAGDARHAETELQLAEQLDAGDPTPRLYSALLLRQENRVNEAVRDLELSRRLNDQRSLYRSGLLLDQDRAVRGANLATLFQDAGLTDVSVREAGRAVNADYANYSAHLFLANSFDQLRDPNRINLRYETAWFSEYLVANLLAPVGAGTLSQSVSQQEYSRLFERDRPGLTSSTEYQSRGAWTQSAAQHGTFGNSSYAAEVAYRSDPGQRPNNDLSDLETTLSWKQQLTAQDSLFFRASHAESESGDLNQYYQQSFASRSFHAEETQRPLVLAGYHHEWAPGSHTLLLAGRLQDTYEVEDGRQDRTLLFYAPFGPVGAVPNLRYQQRYHSSLEIYTGELQQLWQARDHTLVLGARFQGGGFQTRNRQANGRIVATNSISPVSFEIDQDIETAFDRETVYAYDQWQLCPALLLVGGMNYDRIAFPENARYAPLSDRKETRDQFSPKAGFILTPAAGTTIRAAYFRALGGASLDQSVRLEPSQVAGFNQAYRSLIPESVAGANAASRIQGSSLSLEQEIGSGTYAGISGELLTSQVSRSIGAVRFFIPSTPGNAFTTLQTREKLDYRERTLRLTLNQLLGTEWAIAANYRISQASLTDRFPGVPPQADFPGAFRGDQDQEGTLQQVHLRLIYNHRSGLFAGAGTVWTRQSNQGYNPGQPGDDFWQVNLEAGWRFLRRRAEVRLALLNLADQGYRLNPLNLTAELPRERTLAASLRLNF